MPISRRLSRLSADRPPEPNPPPVAQPPANQPASSQLPAKSKPRQVWARTLSTGSTVLSGIELEWKRTLFEALVKALDLSQTTNLEPAEAQRQIGDTCERLMAENPPPVGVPQATRSRIINEIQDEVLGLGPLEILLKDPTVSDILVNGYADIYVERRGKLERTPVAFDSNNHLMTIIERIVSSVGRRIDESSPMVDARLADGSRVNAIIPPLAIDGPSLSIRRFPVERLTMERLLEYHAFSRPMSQFLAAVVEARLNVIISGGTGSGKTTMLNVLSAEIPSDERIVTIEDSAELQMQQPHVVRLETRPANMEDKGEVNQRDLVRNALRMRPDRIVLGEIRGSEALDMLQAMNTGHDGSLTTIHANTARDALSRLETMVAMAGFNLPTKPLRGQVTSALDILIQLERQQDGKRRVISIDEVQGMEGEMITTATIFQFERRGIDTEGNVLGDFKPTGLVPKCYERLRQRGIQLDVSVFNTQGPSLGGGLH
ncbi:CpaF family protein [Halochromatium salexigens]|uniref:Pilus assembly protein CpaF n=1 Tax=Halochromatium salexigens TaxID=49447 RepID=A0AAJ0XG52_HALSE|nr:CpaF family protein [Halochromatium salexigens]MBK5931123.1 pilus assembly protein CpaF [Halochromatium salexigens]